MLFWIDLINRRWNGFHILEYKGDDKVTLSLLNTLYLDDDERLRASVQELGRKVGIPPEMLEVFVEFDGFFLHHTVSLLAAADELEVRTGRHAHVTILTVQPKPQQGRFLRCFLLGHRVVS